MKKRSGDFYGRTGSSHQSHNITLKGDIVDSIRSTVQCWREITFSCVVIFLAYILPGEWFWALFGIGMYSYSLYEWRKQTVGISIAVGIIALSIYIRLIWIAYHS